MRKICKDCQIEKDIFEFSRNGKTSIGTQLYRAKCKSCITNGDYHKQWRQQRASDNIKKRLETRDKCIVCKKLLWITNQTGYCDKHRGQSPVVAQANKEYRELHKEHLAEVRRNRSEDKKNEYRAKDKVRKKEAREKNLKFKEYNNTYKTKRCKVDPIFHTVAKLRNRTRNILRYKKWYKTNKFAQYIGCTREELIKHIESQFQPGMSWDNRHLWHIDHIIPLDSAKDIEGLYRLCNYKNLQPLWAADNLSKNSSIEPRYYSKVSSGIQYLKNKCSSFHIN